MAQSVHTLIKNRIKTKLEEVDKIQVVYDKPQLEFGGMPAATIMSSTIESEPNENASDERRYIFKVRLFYDVDRDNNDSVGWAVDSLYDLVDDVLDKFTEDKDWNSPTSFAASIPANYTWIGLDTAVGEWDQEDERSIIFVDIEITAKFLRDTGACS